MNFKKYQGGAVNKFNKDATDTNNGYLNNTFLRDDNTTSVSSAWAVSEYIDISGISTLSAKNANTSSIITAICYYNDSKAFISGTAYNGTSTQTFTVPSNAKYCRMSYVKPASATMLVEGSTVPSEYHPYYEWNSIPYRKYATSTDTITTLPAVIYANDTTATVGLKGNTYQASGVSPTTPIQPSECGERTGNLWSFYPEQTIGDVTLSWNGEKISYSGTCTSSNNFTMNIKLKAGTYTLKANANRNPIDNSYSCIDIYRSSPLFMAVITNREAVEGSKTFTIDEDMDAILRIRVHVGANYDGFEIRPMLNTGSTALPYEPYGVKIPISSANTTTPVYLGEVETVRQIKKVVFDGTESWNLSKQGNNTRAYTPQTPECLSLSPALCTHFNYNLANVGYPRVGEFVINSSKAIIFGVDSVYTTAGEWKAYLAAQYAAGTPVTVWYVLATEETGIVNEPLRKIGNYADEVSGITIPTIAGANTISVDTTLQPSEVTVNYKGWHPVADVYERENGQWD